MHNKVLIVLYYKQYNLMILILLLDLIKVMNFAWTVGPKLKHTILKII